MFSFIQGFIDKLCEKLDLSRKRQQQRASLEWTRRAIAR